MRRNALLAIGLAGLLVLAGCAGQGSSVGASTPDTSEGSDGGTIEVTGVGSAEAEPNQAVVRVAVTATAADAVGARQQLAENTSQLRSALEEIGVSRSQLQTRRYDLDRDLRRPEREGGEPRVQYRGYHGFEITLNDTSRVGTVIDTAVQNGATDVQDIQFTLSTNRRRQLKAAARESAMADARQTARQLASAGNVRVTGVELIRTTSRSAPRPVEEAATAEPTATPAGGGGTDITSGPVTVVATVHVAYTTEPVANNSTS